MTICQCDFTVTINLDFTKWDFFCHFNNTTDPNIRVSILEIINYKARFSPLVIVTSNPTFLDKSKLVWVIWSTTYPM